MSLAALVVLAVNACSAPAVSAWGTAGHIASARLAQSLLAPAAASLASRLLPDVSGQLQAVSGWADLVRYQPAYSWAYGMAFADTPDFACSYVPARDCMYRGAVGVCVDGAVRNCTADRRLDRRRDAVQGGAGVPRQLCG